MSHLSADHLQNTDTLTEPDLYRFLHIMRDAFANKAKSREKVEDYRNVDDVEAVGCIAGEVAEAEAAAI